MLVSGAVVAPSLRTPAVISLAAVSALYVVLYLVAIFWLLLKVRGRLSVCVLDCVGAGIRMVCVCWCRSCWQPSGAEAEGV